MPKSIRQLKGDMDTRFGGKADRSKYLSAIIGHPDGTVYVEDRAGYVWARVGGSNGQIIQVYARGMLAAYNLPILIYRLPHRPRDYGIADLDINGWSSTGSGESNTGGYTGAGYVQSHAEQHYFTGGDPVLTHLRAWTPLRVYVSTGFTIGVQSGIIPRTGADLEVTSQTLDLTSHIPASGALYVLITVDAAGALAATDGTAASGIIALTMADIPDTPAGHFRLAAVRLYVGQTSLQENRSVTDIVDLRWPQERLASSILPADMTLARGSLIVGNSSGVGTALAVGAANKVLQADGTDTAWSVNTLSIAGNSTINGTLVGNMTGSGTVATGGFTGTIPETMTFAGRNVANTFTAVNTFTAPNSTAITGGLIFTQTKTGTATGVYKFTDWTGTIDLPSNAAGAQDFYLVNAVIQTAADATVYNSANLRSFYLSPQHNGSGTINTAVGGYVHIFNNAAGNISTGIGYISRIVNIGAGKIVNTRNFWAMNVANTGAGTVPDNQYAFYSDSLTTAAAGNYLLYGAGLGRVRVGDDVSVSGGADRIQLDVLGYTTQTAEVARIRRNDGATATANAVARLGANSTGTAAAGFGGTLALDLESSTTADQSAAAIEWSWATATHATRKARITGKVYDTAARTWLQVDTDGATSDVLINSLIYGAMYGDDIAQTVVVSSAGVYYEVGGGLAGGAVNGMTFQNSKELLIGVAGRYLVTWSMSISAGNNDHLEGAVMVNSAVAASTENAAHTPGAGDQVGVSGSGIILLAANDLLKLCVENETDADDITVSHATLTAVRIGE